MSILILLGMLYTPSSIKKKQLLDLVQTTAKAFQCIPPDLEGLSFDQCLRSYADFTRNEAEKAIIEGNESEVKNGLYQGAFAIATNFKSTFHIKGRKDVIRLAKLIYKILKIDFESDQNGVVHIKRCYFSKYYTSQVCRIISSLDEGLLEGLSGGKFKFLHRITEGKECCIASLSFNRSLH